MEMTGLGHRLCVKLKTRESWWWVISCLRDQWFTDRCEEAGTVAHAGQAAGEFAFENWILTSLEVSSLLKESPRLPHQGQFHTLALPQWGFNGWGAVLCQGFSSLGCQLLENKSSLKALFLISLWSNFYQLFRMMCGASNDLLFPKLRKYTTSYT